LKLALEDVWLGPPREEVNDLESIEKVAIFGLGAKGTLFEETAREKTAFRKVMLAAVSKNLLSKCLEPYTATYLTLLTMLWKRDLNWIWEFS
jgi:hypothetical protein